jgi:hypothetical protein
MKKQYLIWGLLALGLTAGAVALYILREPPPTKNRKEFAGIDPSGVIDVNGKMTTSDPTTIVPPREVLEA